MKKILLSVVPALGLLAGNMAMADTVKVAGASTVFNVVVKPHKAKVEAATQHTLEVLSSNTGKGALLETFSTR